MPRIIHPRFIDRHTHDKYPFTDDASLVSSGGQVLDDDLFLDAHLYPIGGNETLYIPRIVVTQSLITIWLTDNTTDQLATAELDPLDPPDLVRFTDAYGRAAGVIVSESGRLARLQGWETGDHIFDLDATTLVAAVCCPTPEIAVRGFLTEDGDIITGDAWIMGESGVVVRREEQLVAGEEVVRIDIVGDPLFKRAVCTGEGAFQAINYLKTINGQAPGPNGDFKITAGDNVAADNILRIRATGNEIIFEAVGEKSGG